MREYNTDRTVLVPRNAVRYERREEAAAGVAAGGRGGGAGGGGLIGAD